ncbi:hypothetical protein JCM10295v2_005592 [Rhodotorula toruloides]
MHQSTPRKVEVSSGNTSALSLSSGASKSTQWDCFRRDDLRFVWWLLGGAFVGVGGFVHFEVRRQLNPVNVTLARLETRMETRMDSLEKSSNDKFDSLEKSTRDKFDSLEKSSNDKFDKIDSLLRGLGQDIAVVLDRTGGRKAAPSADSPATCAAAQSHTLPHTCLV